MLNQLRSFPGFPLPAPQKNLCRIFLNQIVACLKNHSYFSIVDAYRLLPTDFGKIYPQVHFWLWMYRIYIFGLITSVMALMALASLLITAESRVMVWPGITVAVAGTLVTALGAAFYYHHGVWGAFELNGKSASEADAFIKASSSPVSALKSITEP